jgi:tetratricopeptide (TPR) repeat protein
VFFFDRLKRTRSAQDTRSSNADRIEQLWVLVQERPDDWTADNELADALAQDGQIDEAVARLCAIGDRLAAEGFLAKAQAVFKKALRLRPQHEYAASRSAEVNSERINQSKSRFAASIDDPRAIEAAASEVPLDSPGPEPAPTTDHPLDADLQAEESAASFHSNAPEAIEEIADEPPAAPTDEAIDATISALMECARTNPDLIDPVAKLVEVATLHGRDEVRDEAEARLCDFHYRRGDYRAARTVAEALVMRHPDDPRHRARLEFLAAELAESEGIEVEVHTDPPDAAPAEEPDPIDPRTALEHATCDEQHCFAAARQLARLDADAGDWTSALSWLERASTAIPTPADEEELAYDFALVLERAGEHGRALGVLYEIAAKAGAEYRDVSERIQRLTPPPDPVGEQLVAS